MCATVYIVVEFVGLLTTADFLYVQYLMNSAG